jgi:hypothetical protein
MTVYSDYVASDQKYDCVQWMGWERRFLIHYNYNKLTVGLKKIIQHTTAALSTQFSRDVLLDDIKSMCVCVYAVSGN